MSGESKTGPVPQTSDPRVVIASALYSTGLSWVAYCTPDSLPLSFLHPYFVTQRSVMSRPDGTLHHRGAALRAMNLAHDGLGHAAIVSIIADIANDLILVHHYDPVGDGDQFRHVAGDQ
jgi:hypothetical protein